MKNEIRQQIKRLASLESHSEILTLLFHTDYLDLPTLRMFIEETLTDLEKNAHYHNPQESIHLQDFCNNSINLLDIYMAIEQIRTEHSPSMTENTLLFSKEVKSNTKRKILQFNLIVSLSLSLFRNFKKNFD